MGGLDLPPGQGDIPVTCPCTRAGVVRDGSVVLSGQGGPGVKKSYFGPVLSPAVPLAARGHL